MPPIMDPILHELRTLENIHQSAASATSADQAHNPDDDISIRLQSSPTAQLPRVEPTIDTAELVNAQPLALFQHFAQRQIFSPWIFGICYYPRYYYV